MERPDDIIGCYLFGELITNEEEQTLEKWLSESQKNKKIYQRLQKMITSGKTLQQLRQQHNHEAAYSKIRTKIILKKKSKNHRKTIINCGLAASIALLAGFTFLLSLNPLENNITINQTRQIHPGCRKAQLTLADGTHVAVNTTRQDTIISDNTFTIKNEENTLIYTPGKKGNPTGYNTLSVPAGAEYNLILADGTKVCLNSGSELHYPVTFTESCRNVFLKGEAYFEVQKDTSKTFIVHTEQMNIRVLGTSFNVKAYTEQNKIAATLTKGKIQVDCGNEKHEILPGTQISFDKTNHKTHIQKVNTELYTSWKDEYYRFEQMPLEEIMSTLSMWYNINVFYLNPSKKNIQFTGKLKRYDNITELLNNFEETFEVTFLIQGNNVTVK